MDRGGWRYPTGDFRVSDADRDRAISELGVAFRSGRVTADEYDERSAQALAARTGTELTTLLADLPVEYAPAARTPDVDRARLAMASRVAGAAAVAASCYAAIAVAGAALSMGGLTLQERAIAIGMAQRGEPRGYFPPGSGFDWAGVMTPATVAVLLVMLFIVLRVRLARADHSRQREHSD
jgi:hypothetical protein